MERRAFPRTRKQVRVFVSDPADALDEMYRGLIVDRSPGGVCLFFPRRDIEEGNILMVQPLAGDGQLPWVPVRVKNRRRKASRVELGCEFVQRQSWERLLLLD